jgi:ankyrin repeat protein
MSNPPETNKNFINNNNNNIKETESDKNLKKKWLNIFKLTGRELRKALKATNFNEKTSLNQNILHFACSECFKEGIIEIISLLSKENNSILNETDNKNNWPPIFYLLINSDNGEPETFSYLLKVNNINITFKDKNNVTLLHIAAFKGEDEIVEMLINNNVNIFENINIKDKYGRLPINYSIIEGQINSFLLLLPKTDIKTVDKNNNNLLHYAVNSKGNCLLFTLKLIEKKIDLNFINNNGDSPIMLIAKNNPKENIRLLLLLFNYDINLNVINKEGKSFYSIMGEQAIKNHFGGKDIKIDFENKKTVEKIKNYINDNNINNINYYYNNNTNNKKILNNKIIYFGIPFIILLLSYFLK